MKQCMQKHLFDKGYIILESKYNDTKEGYMTNHNNLHNLLAGKNYDGLVDDESLDWQPTQYEKSLTLHEADSCYLREPHTTRLCIDDMHNNRYITIPKRYFSNISNVNVLIPIHQDIIHYYEVLKLNKTFQIKSAKMNIMVEGCDEDLYHRQSNCGYFIIIPYYPNGIDFNLNILQVSDYDDTYNEFMFY